MLKALAMVGVTVLVAIGGQRHAVADPSTAPAGPAATATSVASGTAGTPGTTVAVMPSEAAPGAHVNVIDGNDCSRKTGVATSAAFAGPVKLGPIADMVGGAGRIRRGMKPGKYEVTLSCGTNVTTSVTVAAAGAVPTAGKTVASATQVVPQLPDNKRVTTGIVLVAGLVALFGYALGHRRIFKKSGE